MMAEYMEVAEVIRRYRGLQEDAGWSLDDNHIARDLPFPEVPEGLEAHVEFSEHGEPLMASSYASLPSDALSDLSAVVTSWVNYIQRIISDLEAQRAIMKDFVSTLKATLTVDAHNEKIPVRLVPEFVKANPHFNTVQVSLTRVETELKLLETRAEGLRRLAKAVSREQTRQAGLMEMQNHDEGLGRGRNAGKPHPYFNGRGDSWG
jgi:hypothetical protein